MALRVVRADRKLRGIFSYRIIFVYVDIFLPQCEGLEFRNVLRALIRVRYPIFSIICLFSFSKKSEGDSIRDRCTTYLFIFSVKPNRKELCSRCVYTILFCIVHLFIFSKKPNQRELCSRYVYTILLCIIYLFIFSKKPNRKELVQDHFTHHESSKTYTFAPCQLVSLFARRDTVGEGGGGGG